ncbi:MAG: histidine kinase [Niabella sp.]
MSKLNKNLKIELIVHLLVWVILFYLPIAFGLNAGKGWQDILIHFWMQLFFLAIIFYINYLILIKKCLFTKNYSYKILYIVTTALLIVFLLWLKHLVMAAYMDSPHDTKGPPRGLIWYMDFLIYLIPVAFAIAIQSGKRLIKMEAMKNEAEKIKLEAELQHLKFQLQPHFFFNALNNIYSQIENEPDAAKKSVHDLSKLMRHLLHTSEIQTISLSEEMAFLSRYIDLMRQRLGANIIVTTNFPQSLPHIHIAPLLFISIVENAFKHGVSATEKSYISFTLETFNDSITFTSKNSNFQKSTDDKSGSGIGIGNLRKRLAILYPNRHYFSTAISATEFVAILKLDINHAED